MGYHIHFTHRSISRSPARGAIYAANFLFSLHTFFVVYVNSTYLLSYMSAVWVSTIYVAGAVGGLAGFFLIPRILARFGSFRIITTLSIIEFAIFMGFAFIHKPLITAVLFVLYFMLYPLLLYVIDLLLESLTIHEETTGNIRGTFLTTTNAALVISPLIAGFILGNDDYTRLFITSALFIIPFWLIIRRALPHTPRFVHPAVPFLPVLACLRHKTNIVTVFKAHFLMRLFYTWMVIYTPLYLHQYVGFDWPTIGIIFTVMLLPFILLELPAGKLADGWLGEKELLIAGFIITGLSTAAMSFITVPSAILWGTILFITRIGASFLEIMTETYFFKHVTEDDRQTISCFRMLRPLAYLIGALLGALILFFVPIQYLFLILGIIILFGLRYSLALKDTR